MAWLIGVDVGGTFTDFYALDTDSATVHLYKRPSTPQNPAEAIVEGLNEMCVETDIPAETVRRVCHGTTVATNSLIQRKGGNVAFITTQGFRDLLEIGRQTRPHMFDLQADQPPPLVERAKRFEVEERVTAGGQIITPLQDGSLDRAIEDLKASGAEACAVSLLFSFLDPKHEQAIGGRIAAELPDMYVSLSSDVQPEFREYERFSTTVLNAYLQPTMDRYLGYLQDRLAEEFPKASVGIYQSIGGLMSIQRARSYPIRTALSGPAAGVMGAIETGRQSQRHSIITLDMGGTSADVCLIQNLKAAISFDREVAGFPVRLPMIDIQTVGAGGGSVAWLERDGLLKVGPISAGAEPGPACYGRGGERPTVTDANCLLGRLPQAGLIGGRMTLDGEAAQRAIAPLARELRMTPELAALGILGIVSANMVRAIRTITVEKGHDPAEYSLMAFGGAGPLHAVEVARSLGIREVLIPAAPGILCAQGLILSDLKETFVRTTVQHLSAEAPSFLTAAADELLAEARAWAEAEGLAAKDMTTELVVDMRYLGQNFELPVSLGSARGGGRPDIPDAAALREKFFEAHSGLYGFHNPDAPVELVNARMTALGRLTSARPMAKAGEMSEDPEPIAIQPVVFDESDPVETPVYDRSTFASGLALTGPAIVQQFDATTVVHRGDKIRIDDSLTMIIEVAA